MKKYDFESDFDLLFEDAVPNQPVQTNQKKSETKDDKIEKLKTYNEYWTFERNYHFTSELDTQIKNISKAYGFDHQQQIKLMKDIISFICGKAAEAFGLSWDIIGDDKYMFGFYETNGSKNHMQILIPYDFKFANLKQKLLDWFLKKKESETSQQGVSNNGEKEKKPSIKIVERKEFDFDSNRNDKVLNESPRNAARRASSKEIEDDADFLPIPFEDELVYDLFKDWNNGEPLTYNQAKEMATLPNIFKYTDITSFNELKYFTSLTNIGWEAFAYCDRLTSISLPNSVKSIGVSAFGNCERLKNIVIPNNVTSIATDAFYGCKRLTSLILPERFKRQRSRLGIPRKTKIEYRPDTLDESVGRTTSSTNAKGIEDDADYLPIPFKDELVYELFKKWNNGEPLTFKQARELKELSYIFYKHPRITSFNELKYFTSLTTIGERAFRGCWSLTSIDIPNSVTTIGDWAFEGCSALTSIDIPNSVTTIGQHAFQDCKSLTSIVIPNSVTTIGTLAFEDCHNLTSISIPNSVASIGWMAFNGCRSLISLILPERFKGQERRLFIKRDAKIEYRPDTLDESVGRTTNQASTKSIEDDAEPYFPFATFLNSVPEEIIQKLEKDNIEYLIEGNKLMVRNINEIPEMFFAWLDETNPLTSINFPLSVKKIGRLAFRSCRKLKEVVIPSTVKIIDERAFDCCKSLKTLKICDGVEEIGCSAFEECEILEEILIPNSVHKLGAGAFANCKQLKELVIPPSIEIFDLSVVTGCYSLQTLEVYSKNINSDDYKYAFWGCQNLSNIIYHEQNTTRKFISRGGFIYYLKNSGKLQESVSNTEQSTSGQTIEQEAAKEMAGELLFLKAAVARYGIHTTEYPEGCLENLFLPKEIGNGKYDYSECFTMPETELISEEFGNSDEEAILVSLYLNKDELYIYGCQLVYDSTGEDGKDLIELDTLAGYNPQLTDLLDSEEEYLHNTFREIIDVAIKSVKEKYSLDFNESQNSIGHSLNEGTMGASNNTNTLSIERDAINLAHYHPFLFFDKPVSENFLTNLQKQNVNFVVNEDRKMISVCDLHIITDEMLQRNDHIIDVNIPDSVTEIGEWAFCSIRIEKIKIPNSVTKIGRNAFAQCQKLKTVELPDSISTIEQFTFQDCRKLEKINIPPSVVSIEMYAFAYCGTYTNYCGLYVNIPSSVHEISPSAFLHSISLIKYNDKIFHNHFKVKNEFRDYILEKRK